MIIFGTRMYGKKNVVKGWAQCPQCGKYGKNISYTGRKWGHVYFIPLVPDGPHMRVIMECKKCSQGAHVPEKDVPDILADMRRRVDSALAALIDGRTHISHDGEEIPCAAAVASSIEMLHCLSADDYIELIFAALQEKKLSFAHHISKGESLEFSGQLKEAAELYAKASECEPNDTFPLFQLGSVHMKTGEMGEARVVYEKALGLSEDRFPVLRALITVYESQNDHAKLSETYEECFQLVPELKSDKKVYRGYAKSCKKASRQPVPR